MSGRTPGHRVRVMAETYDPTLTKEAADKLAEAVSELIRKEWPSFTLVAYVEPNPPADEL